MTKEKKTMTRGLGDDPLKWLKQEHPSKIENKATESGPPEVQSRAWAMHENQAPEPAAKQAKEKIMLNAVITIGEAAALRNQLLPYCKHKSDIYIDGSGVASVDTAGLQVLASFVRTAHKHGASVRWVGISDALMNTAQLLGLAAVIGISP